LAVGIGEWKSKGEAVFKNFPLFSFFDGAKVPGFIYQLQKGIEISAKSIFRDTEFLLCGGNANTTECTATAGTPKQPNLFHLPIRCAVESTIPKAGSEFLFIIQATV
jgi:hypothetical protein